MESTIKLRSLEASDAEVASAAAILSRAFEGDPAALFLIEDAERRAELLQVMFVAFLRYGVRHGQVTLALKEDSPAGVGIWLPPEQPGFSDEGLSEAGIEEVVKQWGPERMERVGIINEFLESLHKKLMTEPHWYLSFLGVEPAEHRKGIGSAIIRGMLAQLEATPCYLETATESNVRLYERHGFRVVGGGEVPNGGPYMWAMRWN